MAESKPGLNWANLDHDSIAEMNKFPHSNSFFQSKFQSRNPLNLSEFNNLLMNNTEFHPENMPFNQNTNLNFIGDLNENSLKQNTNLLLQDKSNDMSKPVNFNIPDKMSSNMNELTSAAYGFNKFIPKSYQSDFQQVSQAKLPTPNPFASIPFYFPFLGTYRRPLPPELIEEEPIYVNPRQYERIIKRRIQKASRGLKSDSMTPEKGKIKPYKHLSRHLHAKRRIRGKGGRFLSKEEAERERDHMQNQSKSHTENESPSTSKDHLASTSKSSNGDGDFSQEESDINNPGKTDFNERAPKINDNEKEISLTPSIKNQITTPESKDSKM